MSAANTSSSALERRRGCGWLLLAACIALHGCAPVRPQAPSAGVPPLELPGPRMTPGTVWTGWDDAQPSLWPAHALRGWTVETEPAASMRLQRVRVDRVRDRYALRLEPPSSQRFRIVRLRPPTPIRIPEPFDTVELLLGAETPDGAVRPRPTVWARIERPGTEAESAQTWEIPLGRVPPTGWRLAHHRLPVDPPIAGAEVTMIELRDWPAQTGEVLLLAELTCYAESRQPIVPAWRFGELEHVPLMLHEPLPAPLARVPPGAAAGHAKTQVDRTRRRAELRWSDGDRVIRCVVLYAERFPKMEFEIDGVRVGPSFEWRWNRTGAPSTAPEIAAQAASLDEATVLLRYPEEWRGRIQRVGRSIAWSWHDPTRSTTELELLSHPAGSHIELAFLNDSARLSPRIWSLRDAQGTPIAFLAWHPSPEASAASRWEWQAEADGAARWRAVYETSWTGERPALMECGIFTVAQNLESVWPSWPGPARAGRPEFPTPPWRLVPCDRDELDPRDPLWIRDALRHDPAGQWIEVGEGRYAVKWPLVPLVNPVPPILAADEPAATVWAAELSARAPWAGTDHDPRTPGTGQFRAAWRGWIEALERVRAASHAPVVGSDDWLWFNAPALDGWRIAPERAGRLIREALNPAFALLALRPLGVGFLPPIPPVGESDSPDWDAWMAALIWYGLEPDPTGVDAPWPMERARHLLAPFFEKSRFRVPDYLAFHDGRQWLSPSAAAHAEHAPRRLYARYPPQLELWVNREPDNSWRVILGRDEWELPPFGFLLRDRDLTVFSGEAPGGPRYDYRVEPDEVFVDARGRVVTVGDWRTDGAWLARRIHGNGRVSWQLTILQPTTLIAFRPGAAGMPARLTARPAGTNSEQESEVAWQWENGWISWHVPADAVEMELAWDAARK